VWYASLRPLNEESRHELFLSVLTAIFPGEPGLAGFIEVLDDGSGSDNWSYYMCKAPSPTHQHPTYYRPDALSPNQQCQSTDGNVCYNSGVSKPVRARVNLYTISA